jgi:iron complex outermembrane receptor protein
MRSVFALIVCALLAAPSFVSAQDAALHGTVRDEAGLVLPGALVTILDEADRPIATTHSSRDGTWVVAPRPDGTVRVSVQLTGFRTVVVPATDSPIETALPVGGYTDQVTVTASREIRALATVPASVGVISGRVLETAPGVNLAETLKYVPGVAAGDVSGVDDLRISIRGAGVRAGFGSRGVILLADGFPVTEPDGQTPHFDGQIDLANAERIEVVKGPTSALYGGAALGGVVNVVSRVPSRVPRATARVEAGSYSYGKAHVAGSAGAGPAVVSGTFGYTRLDGFREHNSLRNWAGTGRADWTAGDSRVILTLLATDATLELPGTLDRQQLEANPSQVRSLYVTNDWGRRNTLVRFGGRFERQWGSGQSLAFGSYGQVRDLFHPIFVVIDQDAARYVGNGRYRLTRGRHEITVGGDYDVQWVDDRWFVNAGGQPGFRIRDDDNVVTNGGLYAQDEIVLGTRATITLGIRSDRVRYELQDRRLSDGNASDTRTFNRVSPKVGVTARVGPDVVAYGNVGTGFEAPTLGEVRLPAGFNEEVRPQRSVSVEGGLRGDVGPLSFDAALYRMVVDDEILPETVNSVTVYRNVARATHAGLELSVRGQVAPALSVEGTYAYSRFVLDDFGLFSGNRLPGVPAHMGTLTASYRNARGWDSAISLVLAGETWVNDANSEVAGRYAVLSANAGYRFGHARVFARGENLGDVVYTNRPQVNDTGGFFFYPAPGRSATVGVEYGW